MWIFYEDDGRIRYTADKQPERPQSVSHIIVDQLPDGFDPEHYTVENGELKKADRPEITIIALQAQVDAEKNRRLEEGVSIVAAGSVIRVTGTHEDRIVLGDLNAKAQTALATDVIRYRDADNVIHPLSPTAFQQFWLTVQAWLQAVNELSWTLKDSANLPANWKDDDQWPTPEL